MKPAGVLLALVLLPLLGTTAHADKSFNPVALAARVQLSLVRVEYPDYSDPERREGQTRSCAGFVVDAARGYVLTARHCVPSPEGVSPVYVDGEETRILAINGLFALLAYHPMRKPPLDIRKDAPSRGEPVVSVGYGYGVLTVLVRHVASLVADDVSIDGPLVPGMSGGPTVDAQGRVVFLNQVSNEAMGAGCGGAEIRAFLTTVKH